MTPEIIFYINAFFMFFNVWMGSNLNLACATFIFFIYLGHPLT
jgi:hypothetical protein